MAALVQTHTELLHKQRLHLLCRVCGNRSNKSTKPRLPSLCKYVETELKKSMKLTHHKTVMTSTPALSA